MCTKNISPNILFYLPIYQESSQAIFIYLDSFSFLFSSSFPNYYRFFFLSFFLSFVCLLFPLLLFSDIFKYWNHFVMRLLNLRINLIFIYCGLFVLILVVFVLFLLSLRFGRISPLAFFRGFLRGLWRSG